MHVLVNDGAASVMVRNCWGRTPLEEAERLGNQPMIEFLKPHTQAAVLVRSTPGRS